MKSLLSFVLERVDCGVFHPVMTKYGAESESRQRQVCNNEIKSFWFYMRRSNRRIVYVSWPVSGK